LTWIFGRGGEVRSWVERKFWEFGMVGRVLEIFEVAKRTLVDRRTVRETLVFSPDTLERVGLAEREFIWRGSK
jgi:hypothetical protein